VDGARSAALLAAAIGLLTLAGPVMAAEVSGNARVIGGTVESDGSESDVTQQDYRVTFYQPLSPWLSVNLNYRYGEDRTSAVVTTERTQSTPEFSLLYKRRNLTARLNYFEQRTRGTTPSNNFDVRSALAYVSWRPTRGPSYVLQYRDETNVADTALFGRDTDSTMLQFDTIYEADDWGLRFSHQDSDIDNNVSGFSLDQTRDQLRADYLHRWRDGRYTLAAETWISQVDQTQVAPTGALLAQPVRAVEGLFAVDLSPAFGSLATSSGLVDGDLDTPVSPAIEIGGARTSRNLGLDLGLTRPVSRLEITVDSISDPSLQWEVYQSPDNFNWVLVGGVNSSYDAAFDRYTLQFPETVDRYFKAVNVTVNGLPDVSVTELRALVDVDILGRSDSESNTYRVDVLGSLQPHDLVSGNVRFFMSNEQDVASGRISQEVDQLVLGSDWMIELGHDLQAHFNFRYSEFEQNVAPLLRREVLYYGANLTWEPLETVRGLFELTQREESDDGAGIRKTDQVRARLATQIYPTLSLTSEVSQATVEDNAGGFFQKVVRWSETLEGEPTRVWRLGGTGMISWFDSQGIQTVSRRVRVELYSTWRIVPFLTFSGSLSYSDDDFSENLDQRYSLSWSPGRKLAASLYFQDSDAVDSRRVTTSGGSISYRLNRRLVLFGNASHSETDNVGVLTTDVTSVRLGLRATF